MVISSTSYTDSIDLLLEQMSSDLMCVVMKLLYKLVLWQQNVDLKYRSKPVDLWHKQEKISYIEYSSHSLPYILPYIFNTLDYDPEEIYSC